MKIFISHSMKDSFLISDIKRNLEPYGIELLIAEHRIDLNYSITEKIQRMINDCDLGLILLTQNGIYSKFVDQEIGFIVGQNKPYIQLVQEGFEKNVVGFNYGRDFIPFNPNFPNDAISRITNVIIEYWNKLYEQEQLEIRKSIEKEQRNKEEQKNSEMKILVGLLVGILALGIISNLNSN
jgi:hypothetical protein